MIRNFAKILLFCFFSAAAVFADDEISISGVHFTSSEGVVKVSYNLSGKDDGKYIIALRLSHDGGQTFSIHPETMSGDVGRGIASGGQKQITWEYLKDFPAGLSGNQYVFEVEAVLQKEIKRWPFYIAGTVVGGIVWLVAGNRGDDGSKGKISFTIEADTGF